MCVCHGFPWHFLLVPSLVELDKASFFQGVSLSFLLSTFPSSSCFGCRYMVMGAPHPPANARDAGLTFGLGRPPEKEMATHSSILALEIPQTENLAGYSPWGCERVGHDSETRQQQEQDGYAYNSRSCSWASGKKLSKATEPSSYPTDVHRPTRQAYAGHLLMYWFCGILTRQGKLTPLSRWGHFPREASDVPEVTQLLSSRART